MSKKVANIKPRLEKSTLTTSESIRWYLENDIHEGYAKIWTRMIGEHETPSFEVQSGMLLYSYKHILGLHRDIKKSRTIVFPKPQADVFIETRHKDGLDFRLPFQSTLLQFSSPVGMLLPGEGGHMGKQEFIAILLTQKEITQADFQGMAGDADFLGRANLEILDGIKVGDVINSATIIIDENVWTDSIIWKSNGSEEVLDSGVFRGEKVSENKAHGKRLAIACIGYINCENVYLHKEGEVPEKVNAKRERKGKQRLEPYYVCRIRGVNYESNETGDGTKHGHRYDVRGHFRRLNDGRTTWVRPHQRGLANELYIPKTYVVDK